jgi:hypothetical protein
MEKARRHFLRTISGVAALPAIGSALTPLHGTSPPVGPCGEGTSPAP